MVFEKNMFKPTMPQVATKIEPLEHYLDEQDRLLTTLDRVLLKEKEALRDRKIKELNTITENKSNLMLQLQSNDQKLKLHPQAQLLKSQFAARVQKIKDNLLGCKRRNEVNGKLLALCMNTSKRVYGLLMQSRDRFTKNMTYTQKGGTIARGLNRLSIQA